MNSIFMIVTGIISLIIGTKYSRQVKWCVDHGYRTTFISDIAFEKKLNAKDWIYG